MHEANVANTMEFRKLIFNTFYFVTYWLSVM